MRKTRRSINPNDPNAIRMIIEYIEVAEGLRKAGDRKPTLSEIKELIAGVGSASSYGVSGSSDGSGSSNIVPSTPNSITISPIAGGIVTAWAIPSQKTISKTEIWRSSSNVLANAVQIGFTSGNTFTDYNAGDTQTWYYFFRHVLTVSLGATSGSFSEGKVGTSLAVEPLPSQVLIDANQYTDGAVAAQKLLSEQYTDGSILAYDIDIKLYINQQIANAVANLVEEAPEDGELHGRKDKTWELVPIV